MKSIKTALLFVLCSVYFGSFAQTYTEELLKYSLNDINGTARSISVGGAFSSVGADLSCASSNPAGLGLYRSTEISLSLGGILNTNSVNFLGNKIKSDKLKVNLPHAGAVFAIPINKTGKATNFFQLGFVYTRLADYSGMKEFNAINNNNSKVDVYFNELTSTSLPITYENYAPGTVQAWNTYLIDTFNGTYFKRINSAVTQRGNYIEKGGSNEMNISMSGSVNDKFYIGAAVGIPWMSYERSKEYSENIVQYDSLYGFKQFSQSDYYKASGVGLNLKVGFIVKPLPFWRIGASITTPSAYFKLQETNIAATTSVIDGSTQTYTFASDTFSSAPYTYRYTRPLKATFGTSVLIGKWGFVSVDYELNDYKHMSLNFDGNQAAATGFNQDINHLYGLGHTVKAGAEIAWTVFRFRGGYQWNSTPFQAGVGVKGYDLQRHSFSGGLGYRGKVFFADIAYAHTMGSDVTSLYRASANEPILYNKFTNNRIVISVGFKFGGKKSN